MHVKVTVDAVQKTLVLGDPMFHVMTKQNATFAGSTVTWHMQPIPTPGLGADLTFNLASLELFMVTGPPFYFADDQGQCAIYHVTRN